MSIITDHSPAKAMGSVHAIETSSSKLFQQSEGYKPFAYPWAYEKWHEQQKMHWLAEEVPMADDVKDWRNKLTEGEKNLLTQIFRFFTQSDIDVNQCYMRHYSRIFRPVEVAMMLSAFSNMETIHIDAYSKLIETIGMPELEYQAFLKYKEMKDKHEYMQQFNVESLEDIGFTLAAFGAFTEGLQLFSSFAILLNFPRFNKMKGMGQIVTWSIRDESLHTESIIRLFRTFIEEHPHINTEAFKANIYNTCNTMVHHEDAFIDLAFELGDIEGLSAIDIKKYIRYLADMRLMQLGLKAVYQIDKNPLPWLSDLLNVPEFANFFEARATTYAKGATTGTWDQVWDKIDAQQGSKSE